VTVRFEVLSHSLPQLRRPRISPCFSSKCFRHVATVPLLREQAFRGRATHLARQVHFVAPRDGDAMEGPPPSYDVASRKPAALVVQLQVWHYGREGRSPANNDGLAALFRNHNVQGWEVIPLDVEGVTGPSCHDRYVPVDVSERLLSPFPRASPQIFCQEF
jgi:hypothetical protein